MKPILIVLAISIGFSASSQTKWHPYIGLHVSMDAGGFYVGPSGQVGIDYRLNKQLSLSTYVHFFSQSVTENHKDGTTAHGEYKSLLASLLIETNFFRKENKGLILAGGIGVHSSTDDYTSTFWDDYEKRTNAVAAIRIGYSLPVNKRAIVIELNAVGPYISTQGPPPYYYKTTEILTQLSLGARFIF